MAAAERRQKNSRMASDLLKKGIFHGKRTSHPHHNNLPVDRPGSAAYRRLVDKKGLRA
jgi:hypothetical protein